MHLKPRILFLTAILGVSFFGGYLILSRRYLLLKYSIETMILENNDVMISEEQSINIGRYFLDGLGYTTGKVLFAKHENRTPNFYWYDLLHWYDLIKKPNISEEPRLSWIIRFEQAYRPDHWFEIWIDAYTGKVMGGGQCR